MIHGFKEKDEFTLDYICVNECALMCIYTRKSEYSGVIMLR